MNKPISIGTQSFSALIEEKCLFVDKTHFIKEWWENKDSVTLIARPRRFGKTLTMDMLNCFFSIQNKNKKALFEGLSIFEDEKYRNLQGTYPVIFLSFANIKMSNFEQTRIEINKVITALFNDYDYILTSDCFNNKEINSYNRVDYNMDFNDAISSINLLSKMLYKYYNKHVIILLDEYDTPLQEAYISGYWNEMADFMRSLFNATFKTNPYMFKSIMTGITRISKESIFSDLNHLEVVTATSNKYSTSFGFTEKEVFDLLDEYDLSDQKEQVKAWYDGFTFGHNKDIYNPWSIINLLDKKEFKTYWANTSSNDLISTLCKQSDVSYKKDLEKLINNESITVELDEQIIFNQLNIKEGALWALMLASGYLKVEEVINKEGKLSYVLSLTNYEVKLMMESLISDWFKTNAAYNDFIYFLLRDQVKKMTRFMNELTIDMMSNFDTGNKPSIRTPERFYHGLVLGLLVGLRDQYIVTSNRESGYGRYDIMLEPKDKDNIGIIIEFKVLDEDYDEITLEDTARNAISQINEKQYENILIQKGINNIHKYGFAFKGKEVLIVKG